MLYLLGSIPLEALAEGRLGDVLKVAAAYQKCSARETVANKSGGFVDEIGVRHSSLCRRLEPLSIPGFKFAWPLLLVADVLAPGSPGRLA